MADFSRHYGITFRDPGLLKLALTHRSYLHVTGQGPRDSNERLEFLGDSVLGLVTSEFLYRSHPSEHEGQLTKTKSLLVSKAILSRRALAMGLGRFVLMSHSEVESGGRQRLSILADAFESVIGAVYLDQGFEAARTFIEEWLLRESRVIAADKRHTNYKSHLQEYVQSTYRTHPVYRIRSEMGPDHSKQFMVEVMVGRRVLGEGRGPNKKEAEQAAARNALEAVESGPLSDRETRRVERDAPPRGATVERMPVASSARVDDADVAVEGETEEEGEERRGRRRRGRRGGRGRRDRGEMPLAGRPIVDVSGAEPPAPPRDDRMERGERPERGDRMARGEAPERTEREPRPERVEPATRRERPERPLRPERSEPLVARVEPPRAAPPPPLVARSPELEPLPPASDEDENEEVGRP
jgi:ribonuclease-3